jgi:hypothetical protein
MLLRATRFGDLRRSTLVSENKDFDFQRSPRPQQADQGAPDQPSKMSVMDRSINRFAWRGQPF